MLLNKNNRNKNKLTFVIITGCAGSGKTFIGMSIAKKLKWTYIDKDTVTRDFTDWILEDKGKSKGDRESVLYCESIRPIEYSTTFKVCKENLEIGNSVVLTIPFIAQIQDYQKWIDLAKESGIDMEHICLKFIWIKHDIGREYTRVKIRNAKRDENKLENWELYRESVEGIEPDEKYAAYIFENDTNSIDESYLEDVIEWIRKY